MLKRVREPALLSRGRKLTGGRLGCGATSGYGRTAKLAVHVPGNAPGCHVIEVSDPVHPFASAQWLAQGSGDEPSTMSARYVQLVNVQPFAGVAVSEIDVDAPTS